MNKSLRRAGWVLRTRNVTMPQYSDRAGETSRVIYVVRMRNIPEDQRDDWGTFVKRERLAARVTQQQLGDAVGVARETVWRWETGRQKPENVDVVVKVADFLNADRELALAAADLHVGEAPKPDPKLRGLDPNDRSVRRILEGPFDDDLKDKMLARIRQRREEARALQEKQELEEIENLEQLFQQRKGA